MAVNHTEAKDGARREVDHIYQMIIRQSIRAVLRNIFGIDQDFEFLEVKFKELLSFETDTLLLIDNGETIVHIEIQAQNDPDMVARMGIYAFIVKLKHKKLPIQYVIYVGEEPLRMEKGDQNPKQKISIEIEYIQPRLEWDANTFLKSDVPEEIIWAVFCGGMAPAELVNAIFQRIDGLSLSKAEKDRYLRSLEYLTINTSLQQLVETAMSIYGLNIDITKDRLYKVGKQNERNEMARNTIAVLRQEGKSDAQIVEFLIKLNLSQAEINQALEGLEEQQ
jgi:hypothetical protein